MLRVERNYVVENLPPATFDPALAPQSHAMPRSGGASYPRELNEPELGDMTRGATTLGAAHSASARERAPAQSPARVGHFSRPLFPNPPLP